MKVAVIGGGAAGFFAALACKSHRPEYHVEILEASGKTLSKVKVSGGGRCNVTNACQSRAEFLKHYPRGAKQLKKTFDFFNREETIHWFEKRGVTLKSEEDGRMFPVSDDSQTIIDCLRTEAKDLGVDVKYHYRVMEVKVTDDSKFHIITNHRSEVFDFLIIASGGNSKSQSYDWLRKLGHRIIEPVPSLFTFNIPSEKELLELSGVSSKSVCVKIQGTKLVQRGPVLITHWGLSGPCALKLSAWGARIMNDLQYDFSLLVNWTNYENEEEIRKVIVETLELSSKKTIGNTNPFDLSKRLWLYLISRSGISSDVRWMGLSKKEKNRMVNVLSNDTYAVQGKTTFKEEFVTCGGVDTSEVDFKTMASRKVKGMYLAGEVLNVDGVTGGFNFQAAWSTGYVAGMLGEI